MWPAAVLVAVVVCAAHNEGALAQSSGRMRRQSTSTTIGSMVFQEEVIIPNASHVHAQHTSTPRLAEKIKAFLAMPFEALTTSLVAFEMGTLSDSDQEASRKWLYTQVHY